MLLKEAATDVGPADPRAPALVWNTAFRAADLAEVHDAGEREHDDTDTSDDLESSSAWKRRRTVTGC